MRSPQLGRPSSARLNRREAPASLLQATLQQVAHEQRIVAEAAAEAAAVEASQRRRLVHLPLEATNSRVVSAEDRRTAVGLPLSTPEDQLIVAEAAWKRRQAVRLPLEATDVQVTEAEERAAMKAEAEAAAREARDARATRQKELQRRIQLLEAAGFPSALGTLDRASVTTPLGQACCRLALACSLWPRLCSDSANDLVPEPELLERIGLHLFEQAELKAAQRQIEITEIEITKIETEMAETEIKIPKQYCSRDQEARRRDSGHGHAGAPCSVRGPQIAKDEQHPRDQIAKDDAGTMRAGMRGNLRPLRHQTAENCRLVSCSTQRLQNAAVF